MHDLGNVIMMNKRPCASSKIRCKLLSQTWNSKLFIAFSIYETRWNL